MIEAVPDNFAVPPVLHIRSPAGEVAVELTCKVVQTMPGAGVLVAVLAGADGTDRCVGYSASGAALWSIGADAFPSGCGRLLVSTIGGRVLLGSGDWCARLEPRTGRLGDRVRRSAVGAILDEAEDESL